MHCRAAFDFASSSGYEQMVMEPGDIDGGVLDLVLTDVHNLVEVRIGSPIGTTGHGAIFLDVILEQSISHLLCRQKVYLKNSVDWELLRGDVKGLNWNNIIRSPWPTSTSNKALLCVIRNRVPKRMIMGRTADGG